MVIGKNNLVITDLISYPYSRDAIASKKDLGIAICPAFNPFFLTLFINPLILTLYGFRLDG